MAPTISNARKPIKSKKDSINKDQTSSDEATSSSEEVLRVLLKKSSAVTSLESSSVPNPFVLNKNLSRSPAKSSPMDNQNHVNVVDKTTEPSINVENTSCAVKVSSSNVTKNYDSNDIGNENENEEQATGHNLAFEDCKRYLLRKIKQIKDMSGKRKTTYFPRINDAADDLENYMTLLFKALDGQDHKKR